MSPDSAPDRYRRRRYWPALTVIGVLLIGAVVVWLPMLRPTSASTGACNVPGPAPVTTAPTTRSTSSTQTTPKKTPKSAPKSIPKSARQSTGAATKPAPAVITSLGVYTEHASLEAVRPANPATIALQVYNASTVRGQALAVTDELRAAGFESIKDGANDPLYPAADLGCVAQIRFGAAGAAAARTMLLVAPCAQLVLDSRVDDSVDLALGGRYLYGPVSNEAAAQLKSIRDAATPPAVIEGQTASAKPLPPIPPLPQAACAS